MFSFGKPSKSKFAKQLLKAIYRVLPGRQYHFDAEEFCLVSKNPDAVINLSNVYAEHCQLPRKERSTHLQQLVASFAQPQEDSGMAESFEDAKGHLRPKIWCRATFEFLELKRRIEGGEEIDIPLYPLGSHLYSSLVYDTEAAMRSISNAELDTWGVSYYEALECACQNLEEATMAYSSIGDHFHSAISGDNYDSSRVLLLDRIKAMEVLGDHVAGVPQRDAMYVAGNEDEVSLRILFELTLRTTTDEPRPLSPLPLKLDDGQWVDWVPPKNHTLRKKFDDLELLFLGGLYTDQKELLGKLFEHEFDPPFVASFSVISKEGDDDQRSYCTWGEGVDSMLPKTQLIAFVSDEGMEAFGEWDTVVAHVSDLMQADDSYYPTRYRVREYPSKEVLQAIGHIEAFE